MVSLATVQLATTVHEHNQTKPNYLSEWLTLLINM